MLGIPMLPQITATGGSWLAAIVSGALLVAFVAAWIVYMRRQDRTVAAPRPQITEYPKAA